MAGSNPLIRPLLLRPSASGERVDCTFCGKRQAKWLYLDRADQDRLRDICSLCFLYESPWGVPRRTKIDRLVSVSEHWAGVLFPRDAAGRVTDAAAGDSILSRIAFSSYILTAGTRGSGP